MLSSLGKQGVELYVNDAKDIVLTEKLKFKKYYEIIEKYCIKNEIIVGGKNGIDLILKNTLSKDNFIYELYTDNVFEHSKNLATKLSKINLLPPEYIVVDTIIKNKECAISIDFSQIIKLYNLENYRGSLFKKIMGVIYTPGFFINTLKINDKTLLLPCMGAELQLINIYTKLYSIKFLKEWPDLLILEKQLFETIRLLKTGGNDFKVQKNDFLNFILKQFNEFKFPDYLLIGEYAIDLLTKKNTENIHRLQFITSKSKYEVDLLFEKLVEEYQHHIGNKHKLKMELNEQSSHIPFDFRLKKYIIKVNEDPLIDVFNSGQFELIPTICDLHTKCDYLSSIANVWVIMKFRLIDLFLIQVLTRAKIANINFGKIMITSIISSLENLREFIDNIENKSLLFPIPDEKNFIGIYDDEIIAKKRLVLGEWRGRFYPITEIKKV